MYVIMYVCTYIWSIIRGIWNIRRNLEKSKIRCCNCDLYSSKYGINFEIFVCAKYL